MLEDYHALSPLVQDTPAGVLLNWVISEVVIRRVTLRNVMEDLKRVPEKKKGNGADGLEMERDKVLHWTYRLRLKEQAVAADCRYLKSHASWEELGLLDALLDQMIVNSERDHRILLAVERMVKG